MSTYFEFEVSLEEVQPKIWRSFLLRSSSTFHDLHDTIQKACGWQDYHLYDFKEAENRTRIAESPYCEGYGDGCPNADEIKIDEFFKEAGDS